MIKEVVSVFKSLCVKEKSFKNHNLVSSNPIIISEEIMGLLTLLLLVACNRSENQIVNHEGQTYSGDGEGHSVHDDEGGENIVAKGNAVCTPPDDDNDFWSAISDEDFRDEVEDFLHRFSNNKGSTALGVRWATDPDLLGIYSTSENVAQVSSSDDWTQNAFGSLDSSGCEVTPDIEADLKRILGLDRDASTLVFLTNDEGGSDYLVFSTYNDSNTLGAYLVHAEGRDYEVVYEEQIEGAGDEVEAVEEIMDRIASFVGEYSNEDDIKIYRSE